MKCEQKGNTWVGISVLFFNLFCTYSIYLQQIRW